MSFWKKSGICQMGKKRSRERFPWVVCRALLTQAVCSNTINKLKAVAPCRNNSCAASNSSVGKILCKARKAGNQEQIWGLQGVKATYCPAGAFIRPNRWAGLQCMEPIECSNISNSRSSPWRGSSGSCWNRGWRCVGDIQGRRDCHLTLVSDDLWPLGALGWWRGQDPRLKAFWALCFTE